VNRSYRLALVLGLLGLVVTAGLIAMYIRQAMAMTCEVCITFHGHTVCRSASGPTQDEAVRTATDNACAFLASGMTDSIRCSNTPPTRVTCEGGGEENR
jgi:hypothetical protein